MLPQHPLELFTKRAFSMVLRLVANVSHRRFNSGNADAECKAFAQIGIEDSRVIFVLQTQ